MATIESLVEQRCDEYRQRAAELESLLSESEQELRAAQAKIARLEKLAWRYPPSEDQSPLSWADAYKTDMDDVKDRVNDMEATIAQQGAVIAAMREALESARSLATAMCVYAYHKLGCAAWDRGENNGAPCTCGYEQAIADTAQLAADHDAAIRADERRKVLEEVRRVIRPNVTFQQNVDFIAELAAQPEEDKG